MFLKPFLMIFLSEMGDKSQFFMLAMTAEYKIRQIFMGVIAAILSLNCLAVLVGNYLSELLPTTFISFIAGVTFLLFAYFGLFEEEEDEKKTKGGVLAIFGAYFLSELGDKTQIATLAMSADSQNNALFVFLSASIGLFCADLLGFLLGYFLGKSVPTVVFQKISFFIFVACGTGKLIDAFTAVFAKKAYCAFYAGTLVSAMLFIYFSLVFLKYQKRKRGEKSDSKREKSVPVFGHE